MVSDEDPERLRFIASLGLRPGVTFRVVGRQPFHGPVTIRVMGSSRDQVVGYELARGLYCMIVPQEVG